MATYVLPNSAPAAGTDLPWASSERAAYPTILLWELAGQCERR